MNDVLQRLQRGGVLASVDVQLAYTLERLCPGQSLPVLLGAAFASRAIGHGHVCADLRDLASRPLVDESGAPLIDLRLPSVFEWVMELGQSELCSDGSVPAPLVFDGEARLYLTRYWRYQERLAASLARRARIVLPTSAEKLRHDVQRLFEPGPHARADPKQMLAAVIATARRLAVICGGPGTGKTTTVVRVLALLVEEALATQAKPPRILLLAPTGKAAARLSESIGASRDGLPCSDAVRNAIPLEATTIHRCLGFMPGHPTRFAHDAAHPLPADVVLVDEASMVDLALMSKLVDAIPNTARLIMLGDKDQLASVEAGAILGDICNTTARRSYSQDFAHFLSEVLGPDVVPPAQNAPDRPGPWDCVVELTHSFRFQADEGIGRFARAVGEGRPDDAVAQLEQGDARVELHSLADPKQVEAAIRPAILKAFDTYFRAADAGAQLHALESYRLLCAHRRGAFGTERINRTIESLLARDGKIHRTDSPHYDGRPILITSNDYQLELFNGDVGVIRADEAGELHAFFRGPNGALRRFVPSRLPPHETVFAMTVHKSQGSEFERVGLLLPPALSPILTRELVYTGVTRAKQHVTLYGTTRVLRDSIARRIDRASGLRDALWSPEPAAV